MIHKVDTFIKLNRMIIYQLDSIYFARFISGDDISQKEFLIFEVIRKI